MNPDWQTFLEQSPPKKTTSTPSGPAFIPLSSWRIISVQGEDAANFLQNISTNDVHSLAINQAQLNSLCNPKGRLLSIFWLLRRQNGFQIVLPESNLDILIKRLRMYVLRSNVAIKDQSDDIILLGNIHADSSLIPLQGKQQGTSYILRLPGNIHRTLILATRPEDAINLKEIKSWVEEINWQRIDIESGQPFIHTETIEKFTPQQVNLDLLDGISFNKGCYPGQEIVARLHYLGTPSRRLFSATAKTNVFPDIGSEIILKDKSVIGHIVQAQYIGDYIKLLLSLKLNDIHQTLLLADKTILSDVKPASSK